MAVKGQVVFEAIGKEHLDRSVKECYSDEFLIGGISGRQNVLAQFQGSGML